MEDAFYTLCETVKCFFFPSFKLFNGGFGSMQDVAMVYYILLAAV